MPTQEEIQENLNEALGVEVAWTELNNDDLKELWEAVDSGIALEPMAKHQMKNYGEQGVDEAVESWEPGMLAAKFL